MKYGIKKTQTPTSQQTNKQTKSTTNFKMNKMKRTFISKVYNHNASVVLFIEIIWCIEKKFCYNKNKEIVAIMKLPAMKWMRAPSKLSKCLTCIELRVHQLRQKEIIISKLLYPLSLSLALLVFLFLFY